MQKTPPKVNPKRKPPKVNPKLLILPRGTWVELVVSDQSFSCAHAGQIGQVSAFLGNGFYRVILKCGHIYETSKVRRYDGKVPDPFSDSASQMSVLRVGRRRRGRGSDG